MQKNRCHFVCDKVPEVAGVKAALTKKWREIEDAIE